MQRRVQRGLFDTQKCAEKGGGGGELGFFSLSFFLFSFVVRHIWPTCFRNHDSAANIKNDLFRLWGKGRYPIRRWCCLVCCCRAGTSTWERCRLDHAAHMQVVVMWLSPLTRTLLPYESVSVHVCETINKSGVRIELKKHAVPYAGM